MGLIFVDPGGEYYFSAGASATGVWNTASGGVISNSAPGGRATSYGFGNNLNSVINLSKTLPTNYPTLIVGVAVYVGSFNTNQSLVEFLDLGTIQCDLKVTAAGALFFSKNGSTTPTGSVSPNNTIYNNSWFYIEVKATPATSGSMEVRVNGAVVLTVSGNFQQTANAYANQITIHTFGSGSASTNFLKDMYILDTGTGSNTNYLGDITVAVQYPNAAGVNNAWTPSAGTAPNEYQMVQDGITHTGSWPDGDTTYISSNTPGQLADFSHQALTFTGTIFGVVHTAYCKKDDAGSRTASLICISTGTTETGTAFGLTNTYGYFFDVLETDPHTNASWTLTNYNSATFGIKEVS